MRRIMIAAVVGWLCIPGAAADPGQGPLESVERFNASQAKPWRDLLPASEPAALSRAQRERCCKVCRTSQACGDSCIARDKTCTKPPGCACDAGRD